MTRTFARAFGAFALAAGLGAPALAQTEVTAPVDSAAAAIDSTAQAEAARAAAEAEAAAQLARDRRHAREIATEGTTLLQAGNFADALAKFEAGVALDSTSLANTYGRAVALAQLGRTADAVPALERSVALAQANGDTETLAVAQTSLDNVRQSLAANAQAQAQTDAVAAYTQAGQLLAAFPVQPDVARQALPLLQQFEAAGIPEAQLPYLYARVYNALGDYAQAATYAQRAVEANAGAADLSGYYYELGVARAGAGDAAGARQAYQQASNGQWAGWAQHQLGLLGAAGQN